MLLYTPSTTRLGPYGQGTGLKDGEIPMCQRRFSAIRVPWALPFLLLGSLSWATGAAAQKNDPLNQRLESSRYSLTINNGQLAGTGASIVTGALDQAQFVLVGEDHGIAQIPEFWSAICRTAVPAGFHTIAIETGPLAAAQLQEWIRQPDAETRVARFEKEHPDSMAFYNFKQEFEMLQHCADQSASADFHLWGLDQEFLGSAAWILEQVLQTHPGPQSRAAIEELLKESNLARAKAEQSGSPADLYLAAAKDEHLSNTASALRKDGNAEAQALFAGLVQSHEIYAEYMRGSNYLSNRTRAQLMKRSFAVRFEEGSRQTKRPPKVLVKMGADHLYRGRNPLHSSELGDYIAEIAEGAGAKSLHILVLGVKGSQLRYGKVGSPYEPGSFDLTKDPSYAFMKPMFDNLLAAGWTMYDLRPLRDDFDSLLSASEDMERLVFGYDLLVLIPQASPSTQIR